LLSLTRTNEALPCYREAVRLNAEFTEANRSLALVLGNQGQLGEAVSHFAKAASLATNAPEAHAQLGLALFGIGNSEQAVRCYRNALRLSPDYPEVLNNLAWILATDPNPALRNGDEAVEFAGRACDLTRYRAPVFVGTLAAAYAETGRFAEAVKTAERACRLAEESGQTELAARNLELLERYRQQSPFRENR
jgi:protein O-mannosyl-transferase